MTALAHRLNRTAIVDREAFLMKRARGRSVLHLGCADAPYFRAGDGTLLHAQLAKVAREIVGIDIDEEGVRFLTAELGFKDIFLGDVEALSELGLDRTFDLVVAGELIEHLPNPGRCLTGVKDLLGHDGSVILTVPNAFSIKGFMRVIRGVEFVHPDHVSYFSPVTMRTLLGKCGYSAVSHVYYASRSVSSLKRALDSVLLGPLRFVSPYVADGLLVEAKVAR